MAIIEIIINSKTYQIVCDDEDSIKLKEYSSILDDKISSIKNQAPDLFLGLNNETLFIFSALSLIEDLLDLQARVFTTDQIDNLCNIVSKIKKNMDSVNKNMLK